MSVARSLALSPLTHAPEERVIKRKLNSELYRVRLIQFIFTFFSVGRKAVVGYKLLECEREQSYIVSP